MKRYLILFLFAIGTFLNVYANDFDSKKKQISEKDIANPNNVYDYVGLEHNAYLKDLSKLLGKVKTEKDLEGIIYELIQGDVKQATPETMAYIKKQIVECTSIEGGTPNLNQLSSNGLRFYNQLIDVFSMCTSNTEICLLKGINEFKKIEDQITSSTIDKREKEILLSSSAVGRYSIHYWFYNATSWANSIRGRRQIQERRPFSWGEMGKVDLQSAGAAGLAGAVIGGTVSLGALTVPSWAAGAVAGGIGGSAGNAIGQLLGW